MKSAPYFRAVTIHWTGLLDWTTGLDNWTGLLDWTTGLDYWTGLLAWTTGLDNWTEQLDWTTGLNNWTGLLDWTTGLDYWTEQLDWTTGELKSKHILISLYSNPLLTQSNGIHGMHKIFWKGWAKFFVGKENDQGPSYAFIMRGVRRSELRIF
jgi:hypothetical protein